MLSTDEVTAMRVDVLRMLPGSGYILAPTETSDGQGGFTTTWGTVTATAYRLDPLSGNRLLAGGAVQPFHAYQLTLPYNAVITTANRFKDSAGAVYSVKSVDTGKTWAVSLRAVVERI